MDTKALRQKVLDLAIRGKLVPQDPNDEPASVLLERIRQQKRQMVKDGKLKAKDIKNDTIIFVGDDNLHYEKFADGSVKCIEDEIRFELPEGWAWARLVSLSSVITDGEHKTPRRINEFQGYYLLSARNIQNGFLSLVDVDFVDKSEFEKISKRCNPKDNDVLISCSGSIGRVAVVNDGNDYVMVRSAAMVRPVSINPYYLMFALRSGQLQTQMQKASKQTAQANLFLGAIQSLLVPVPPKAEAQRITQVAGQAISVVNEIEENRESASRTILQVKAKILDLAIRGQLVPQDPADEPASVLLERIRAEKEELIKQGKIKRDKKESVIFRGEDNSYYEKIGDDVRCIDEEIPFDIPDTWEWVRLENCCSKEIRRGKSPKYTERSGTLVFAQKCNTKYNGIDVGLALYLDEDTLSRYPADEYMQDGDVVVNSTGTGTLGRVGIYCATDNHLSLPIVPDSHVTVIRAAHSIQAFYMYAFIKANQSELEKKGEGSTNQKELKPLTLKEMLIPIPPYSEQERIAAAITAAFSTISSVEKNLN